VIVGISGADVFVELGPRMQGVIAIDRFDEEPEEGDVHTFTLRGKEEGLWSLRLIERGALRSWESMEPGSIVQARAVRTTHGGLQMLIGRLHAFMPRSQCGLPRERSDSELVGKTFACEVIEVDSERQRCVLSRRLVLQRERSSPAQRAIGGLQIGQEIEGRVTRIEEYGVFLGFGKSLTGLVHVSNLSHDRIDHPSDLVKEGEHMRAKVLYIRQGGRRIGLGVKQLDSDPWIEVEQQAYVGQLVDVRVERLVDFGAFVRWKTGVTGLLPLRECGRAGQRPQEFLSLGQELTLRIMELDPEGERITFSMLHPGGALIQFGEAEGQRLFAESQDQQQVGGAVTNLGKVLSDLPLPQRKIH
jgi:small subunit ribosomal protein S1